MGMTLPIAEDGFDNGVAGHHRLGDRNWLSQHPCQFDTNGRICSVAQIAARGRNCLPRLRMPSGSKVLPSYWRLLAPSSMHSPLQSVVVCAGIRVAVSFWRNILQHVLALEARNTRLDMPHFARMRYDEKGPDRPPSEGRRTRRYLILPATMLNAKVISQIRSKPSPSIGPLSHHRFGEESQDPCAQTLSK